jgi:signal transduction histidine kinase/CheY-like chemotaxis protein
MQQSFIFRFLKRWGWAWVAACALWLAMAMAAVHAQPVVLDAHSPDMVSLTDKVAVLEDPQHDWTLDQVRAADQAGQFQAHYPAAEALNFGYTPSAYWLRLQLRNDSDQSATRMLELAYSGLSHVQVHQPDAQGRYQTTSTGSVLPFDTRAYPSRFFVFPVQLPAHAQHTLYVRVQSLGPISFPARLWREEAFHAYERVDYAAQAWYFGMAMAMVVFNLLLYLMLRDVTYGLYVLFVSSIALTLGIQNGLVKQLHWIDWPWLAAMAPNCGYSLSLAALLLFMRKMLNTPTVLPRFDGVLRALVWVFALSPLAFAVALPTFIKPAAFVYAATGALVLGTGVVCAIHRQRSAYYFVAAFVVLSLAAVVTVLRFLGWIPTNVLTVNALQFGSALEMLVLAFALADRFNTIRRERALAQKEALQAQHRLVEILQSSERELEERVAQRTADLDSKNTELEKALTTLEDVERIARHDLKTPLVSLAAAPDLLRAGRTMSAQEENVLRMIEHAAGRALSMVNLSLDLYRMENGTYAFHPSRVDMAAIVGAVERDLSVHASSKQVSIRVSGADVPVWAWAEDSLCYSILANLIKNAIEAAPEGSAVFVALHVGKQVQVLIHNEGAVPRALRDKFFEKYATASKVGGSGLGTYSSWLLARTQGGSLVMETSDTEGTTLTLTLPLALHAPEPSPSASAQSPTRHATTGRAQVPALQVLLVDDDDFNRMVMGAQLELPSVQLDTVINGRFAVDAAMRRRFDIIIMDIEMPIMDGADAMLRIREFQASAGQKPSFIVAATSHDDELSRALYMSLGFDRCLNKPSTRQDIADLLRAVAA